VSSADRRRLNLGVDTGGTFTDAAILDGSTHEVLATAKSLTTKDDLAVGVIRAITAAVAELADDLSAADIALVSVSTTLATNAVVEGHGDRVAAVFIGFDDDMVERTGITRGFPDTPIIRIGGGHDHAGNEIVPLGEDALRDAVESLDDSVCALAICGAFATRNPDHEHRAGEIAAACTTRPITLSSELSAKLDAPRRALTSVLNARLIGRTHTLIGAVRSAMNELDLDVPLMLVKGDGSRARASTVARRPIETVLSGPAASMVGAAWLSGLDDFILSDIGGTTTDVGVMIDGRLALRTEGAEVGGWRTMVPAGDLRTIGLGGDSDVTLDGVRVVVGPGRVVPLSLVATQAPEVRELLAIDLADELKSGASHGRFVLLPSRLSERPAHGASELSQPERDMLARIGGQVRSMRTVLGSARDSRVLDVLRRRGLVQVAAFTPTDAAHVLGVQSTFNRDAAVLGARLLARFRTMAPPTDDDVNELARDVINETVRASCRIVLHAAFAGGTGAGRAEAPVDSALVDHICRGHFSMGLVRVQMTPTVPIVAVGGPAPVFYDEVARRLGTTVVYPPHWQVANAVGAATGVVSATVVVVVESIGDGVWGVHGPTRERGSDPAAAVARARSMAIDEATRLVTDRGAVDPVLRVTVRRIHLPGFDPDGDQGLLSAEVRAEAVGSPAI
jgi:N-methylhydantoinase A/oxoprolinase/acetone carboxylase beta subunit